MLVSACLHVKVGCGDGYPSGETPCTRWQYAQEKNPPPTGQEATVFNGKLENNAIPGRAGASLATEGLLPRQVIKLQR